MNKILLNEPLAKWLLLKRRHSAYHGLLKPNRICRLGETSELSMEEYPPSRPSIRAWHKKFMETGTVFDKGMSERPRTSEENIEYRLDVLRATNGAHTEVC